MCPLFLVLPARPAAPISWCSRPGRERYKTGAPGHPVPNRPASDYVFRCFSAMPWLPSSAVAKLLFLLLQLLLCFRRLSVVFIRSQRKMKGNVQQQRDHRAMPESQATKTYFISNGLRRGEGRVEALTRVQVGLSEDVTYFISNCHPMRVAGLRRGGGGGR